VPTWPFRPSPPDITTQLTPVVSMLRVLQNAVTTLTQRINAMSDSFAAEQLAFTAAFADLKAAIAAKMDAFAAQLAAAQAAGGATPDQLAQMAADVQAIKDETAALTPPAAPAA
jgi:hypothetical protein